MKQKTGTCIDCGYFGGIIAKRCQNCYWAYRARVKKDKGVQSLKISQTGNDDKKLGVWFAEQIAQIPAKCEECSAPLYSWAKFLPAAIIAHILPKRKNGGFPDVAKNPNNRMFYCPDCHTNFDQKGHDHVKQMKSLPLIKERLSLFIDELSEADKNRVPDYLKC